MAKKKTSSSAKSAGGTGTTRRRRSTRRTEETAGATAVAEPVQDAAVESAVTPAVEGADAPPGTRPPKGAVRKKARKKSTRARKKATTSRKPAPAAEEPATPTPEDHSVESVEVTAEVVELPEPESVDVDASASSKSTEHANTRAPRRKRSSRGGRGRKRKDDPPAEVTVDSDSGSEPSDAADTADTAGKSEPTTSRSGGRGRRGGRDRSRRKPDADSQQEKTVHPSSDETTREDKPARRGRRGGRSTRGRSSDQREPESPPAAPIKPSAGRDMLINVSRGEECRIAIIENRQLEELYVERASLASHVGNIYKAVVTNVEPSIQAAFIDFGIGKNGFLHISDLQPQYFPGPSQGVENVGQKISRRNRPPIQKCLKKGDQVIVQVIKEGIGTKGPTLSTYLSIPGRYLVMMPGMSKIGVSRKIEDDADRQGMREVLASLTLPPDMGFILRTAGLGRGKGELQRDLNYLKRLWKAVVKRIKSEQGPSLLYKESDLVTRTIRDVVTADFERIVVDDPQSAESAREFLSIAMPRSVDMVELYEGKEPLFHRFDIEEQIESIYSKHVPLKSGGSLVIESTEALVAIDVNSGKYRAQQSAEATAVKINIEAAEAIAHQLRLRDLGGLIICDFIDMPNEKNRRLVERTLRDALKGHKERVQILRISQFGIIEMTRQRQRPSIKRSLFDDCAYCKGSGLVKTIESSSLDVMRLIQVGIHQERVQQLTVSVAPDIGFELLNRKRAYLAELERELEKQIIVRVDPSCGPDDFTFVALDIQQREVKLDLKMNGVESRRR